MLARRVVAFIIDVVIIAIPLIVGWMFIFVFGLITFGLGWALFWLMSPGSVIWALVYYGVTLGGPASATIGMRAMEIEMRTWYGAPSYFVLGAVHAIVFWITVSVLTPFILVVGFFNDRRRLLHDMLVGTVLINNPRGRPRCGPRGRLAQQTAFDARTAQARCLRGRNRPDLRLRGGRVSAYSL